MSDKKIKDNWLAEASSNIKKTQEVPEFSRTQLRTFNSKYVDSYDEVNAVLDETNKTPLGLIKNDK